MPTKTLKTPFRSRIDLPDETKVAIGVILNERLADFLDLERQAKHAHWNVKGPHFGPLHKLFDEVASLAVGWADELAERAIQLGCTAEGTLQVITKRSRLPEAPLTAENALAWVTVVSEALAFCANATRADIEEADAAEDDITADILTRITGEADKLLWMVEAHLQQGE